ncbi:FtsK/SpoIIIE domain-containing protein [Agromyces sp. NPDC004153]
MDRPPPEHLAPSDPQLALPPRVPDPVAPGFPWLAAIAPLAAAAVLWAVTGSALSLAFAALGPLVAVASVVDARRQGRRARRRGAAERAALLAELRSAVADRHAGERAARWRRVTSAREIIDGARPIDWRAGPPGRVVLGHGTVASGVRVDGVPADDHDRALLRAAGALGDAPVVASLAGGIGVVGIDPVADALARALVVQVAHGGRPDEVGIAVPAGDAWGWSTPLPHRGGPTALRVVGRSERDPTTTPSAPTDADGVATIAVADAAEHLPPGLETLVMVEDHRRAVVERRGEAAGPTRIVPDLVGAVEASEWADRVRAVAERERWGPGSGVPARIPFDALEQPACDDGSRTTLRAVVGESALGPLALDLVVHGPHAIIAGTTGSGKSEFLVAWLAALATCHPPERVAFLLVDFKGGAAFEPLRGLPHVTGIVTDLDEAEAERAVLSLRAELRHREAVLLAEGVRDLAALPDRVALPRLVLVVDEYQAMIDRFPDLGTVVADVAARGRSLGVHLVLASQRPNGVVREQVSANCAIRVSLRVRQRADSVAIVGTDAAAAIRPDTPGRGVVDPGDGCPVVFQSAVVDPGSLERLRRSTSGMAAARRPWMDPLPARLAPSALAGLVRAKTPARDAEAVERGPALAFGILDDPERQRHVPATWTPESDGHLLILGEPGSGRSTALAALAAAARAIPVDIRRLTGPASARWDALRALVDDRRRATPCLLLVDDLDVAFRDWPDDHRIAAVGMLERLLREGRERGLAIAASAGQAHRLPAGLRETFGSTVLLRHPTRTELAQAGGTASLWRSGDLPGSGQWRERRLQVVDVPSLPSDQGAEAQPLRLGTAAITAVVSMRPRADAATLRRLGDEPVLLEPGLDAVARAAIAAGGGAGHPLVIVGDADAWTANWSLAALLREEAAIVVHGGSREFRVFARDSALPPLLDDPVAQCWLAPPGGAPMRCAWPVHTDN